MTAVLAAADCLAPLQQVAFADVPAHHAALAPEAPAISCPGGAALSYAQLARRIDDAAAALWHGWGVRPGDRVAWLGLNHPAQLVLLFALARIGAMLLPINFRLAPAEWDGLLRDCTPCLLLHDDAWADAAVALGARTGTHVRPATALESHAASRAPRHDSAGATALLVYTSGTTGGARAAMHTQANLLANMRIAAEVQAIVPHDRIATVLPLFHVGGLCIQTLPALYAGACVVLHPRFTPDAFFDGLAADRPTLTLQVPATMQALLAHPLWPDTDFSCLRAVWAGSSVLPARLVNAFLARGVPLCNVYGATETGPFSIALGPAFAATHAGSCGWPAPGVQARLAGGADSGEILLRGPNVATRYWPAAPTCDADGWFHTGDLAVRAADGSYTVQGRARELIISGGENIHPGEIEALLAEHPCVADCAAFGVPHARWGEAVCVAVVCQPGAALTPEALQAHLAGRLARYKQPRHLLCVDALPRTALGKLQRGALAALAADALPGLAAAVAPALAANALPALPADALAALADPASTPSSTATPATPGPAPAPPATPSR